MNQQEYLIRLSMIEQEAQKLEERLRIFEEQIQEMTSVKLSIERLESDKSDKKEILANLGKGIFVKSEIKDKNLLVNVGSGVLVEKSLSQTSNIINEQIAKLIIGKEDTMKQMSFINEEMNKLANEAQESNAHSNSHKCEDKDCECEEPCEECECEKVNIEKKR